MHRVGPVRFVKPGNVELTVTVTVTASATEIHVSATGTGAVWVVIARSSHANTIATEMGTALTEPASAPRSGAVNFVSDQTAQ